MDSGNFMPSDAIGACPHWPLPRIPKRARRAARASVQGWLSIDAAGLQPHLAGFLFAFWVALSGHYTPVLVAAGVASAVLCTLAAIRMRVADAEGHPIELVWGAV